jgi:hypothetical protein
MGLGFWLRRGVAEDIVHWGGGARGWLGAVDQGGRCGETPRERHRPQLAKEGGLASSNMMIGGERHQSTEEDDVVCWAAAHYGVGVCVDRFPDANRVVGLDRSNNAHRATSIRVGPIVTLNRQITRRVDDRSPTRRPTLQRGQARISNHPLSDQQPYPLPPSGKPSAPCLFSLFARCKGGEHS